MSAQQLTLLPAMTFDMINIINVHPSKARFMPQDPPTGGIFSESCAGALLLVCQQCADRPLCYIFVVAAPSEGAAYSLSIRLLFKSYLAILLLGRLAHCSITLKAQTLQFYKFQS